MHLVTLLLKSDLGIQQTHLSYGLLQFSRLILMKHSGLKLKIRKFSYQIHFTRYKIFCLPWDVYGYLVALRRTQVAPRQARCHDTQHYCTQHYDTQHIGTQLNDAQHHGTQLNYTQRNDTQLNDTQLNDTQLNDTQPNDTQLNDTQLNGTQHNDTQRIDTQHKAIQRNRTQNKFRMPSC